ncbi:nucleotide-diphospho-sugar transferase [Nitzschia inconspicua]|uniref:Nucleotide-diphospho-sugar transferase n=1 Tax=Nitzschia inconspicua TaxID=303405 RepID=A0A9K3KY99_9STRA|nr:nucleotide-diphospho-sugar transferase [Nitzschia inconspicua]
MARLLSNPSAPSISSSRGNNTNNTNSKFMSMQYILSHLLFGCCCTYLGLILGMNFHTSSCPSSSIRECPCLGNTYHGGSESGTRRQQQQQGAASNYVESSLGGGTSSISSSSSSRKFPRSLDNMFVDYATVPREDFNRHLEIGVPFDKTIQGAEDVLVLYTNQKSLPSNSHNSSLFNLHSEQAFENCHSVKVILQEPSKKRRSQQCIAIVPQWESYYVHKFMRLPRQKLSSGVDYENPLRYVSRSHADDGKFASVPMLSIHTQAYYKVLMDYLSNLDRVVHDLQRILRVQKKKSRGPDQSNAFIVMVCNLGQSELLHNFVCNAKAKGIDLSRVIVFATDEATLNLCKGLGINAYYDKEIFGEIPENAAKGYGDKIFVKMMMAKVFCVHLVLSCGYDVLFQDVDVVMFKNPLAFFASDKVAEWDMMFQDDGARSMRYQPYSPNTGFYYVRNSPVTMYFFGVLLRMGDLVASTKSHQAALTALLNEFASWKGLRIKTWRMGDENPFPGGVEYHRHKDYMRAFVDGKMHPYIFHMSWTENKENKKLFLEQLGEWYLREDTGACSWPLDCCLATPNITCHYKDKPSKIPCKSSPNIDKRGKSFWA